MIQVIGYPSATELPCQKKSMNNPITRFLFIATLSILSGCATTGLTTSSHLTNVELSSKNYQLIATNVTGEATSEGVLGASFGVGIGATQFSFIPITTDRALYQIAMQNLWSNFEGQNGKVANRTLALVNLRYDSETLNTFLYTRLRVVVVSDVVEFK